MKRFIDRRRALFDACRCSCGMTWRQFLIEAVLIIATLVIGVTCGTLLIVGLAP